MRRLSHQSGFTYLAVLILVAILGAVWAAIGVVWSTAQQREKERELLFVGNQFRKAIGQYYERSPGGVKKYPTALKDLLKDERQLGTQRYLRKIFVDPMTNSNNWGLLQTAGSGIVGVYSLSEATPLKTSNFSTADSTFEGSTKYSAWQFIHTQQVQVQNPPTQR